MSFDPNNHLMYLKGKPYLPVASRLVWFRQDHPDWSIVTTPVEISVEKQYAVFSTAIMDTNGKVIATATKMENVKGFPDYLEKAETGSVGRALAMCGYGTQFAPEFDEGERLADSPIEPQSQRITSPNAIVVPPMHPAPANDPFDPTATVCAECGATLTPGQKTLSTRKYGRPFCPKHTAGKQLLPAVNTKQEAFIEA